MGLVRTKVQKTERIEIRCSKGFKQNLMDLSVQNGMSLSAYIEAICTDKIIQSLDRFEAENLPLEPKKDKNENNYEDEIWRLLQDGVTPTETAKWLNEHGYKPQRSKKFTIDSVHSIRQRLKKRRL